MYGEVSRSDGGDKSKSAKRAWQGFDDGAFGRAKPDGLFPTFPLFVLKRIPPALNKEKNGAPERRAGGGR